MSDHPDFQHNASRPETGEMLAAYLAGELDDVSTARIERALLDDAELRAQLDGIHDTVIALRQVDDVEPPADLRQRLTDHLTNLEQPPAAKPKRTARERQSQPAWWRRPITAAAAFALVGIVAISSLAVLSGGSGDEAASDTAMMAQSAEGEEAGGEERAEVDGDSAEAPAAATESAAGGAVAADAATESADDAAETGNLDGAAESSATELIGPLPLDRVVRIEALSSAAARQDFLAGLRSREGTPSTATGAPRTQSTEFSAEAETLDQQLTALQNAGLDASCAGDLLSSGQPARALVETTIDDVRTVGTVTEDSDGMLLLRLVDVATCEEIVAEQRN